MGVYDVQIFIPEDAEGLASFELDGLTEDLLGYSREDVSFFRSPDIVEPLAIFRRDGETVSYSQNKSGDWSASDIDKPKNFRPYGG